MPANLVFYPYQLEDGSYIDKVSGKKLSMYGDIDKYPINITPYKTPKNYLGGGGMYKSSANRANFVLANWNILNSLSDFTMYFWTYKISNDNNGFIFTADDSDGTDGIGLGFGRNFLYYHTGTDSWTYYTKISNRWVLHEYTFKQSKNNYIVTGFYDGKKQFSYTFNQSYVKHNRYFYGNWSYIENYYANGFFDGYVYDLSIYDDILHTKNYNTFPIREMHYKINYTGMQNENDMYGIKNNE